MLGGCARPELDAELEVDTPTWAVPYARELHAAFDREVTLHGEARSGPHVRSFAAQGRDVVVPLVGLYADAEWTVEADATDDAGRTFALAPVTFRTAPLPDPFPPLSLDVAAVAPAPTLLPLRDGTGDHTYVALVDGAGEVIWLYDGRGGDIREVHPAPDGDGIELMHGEQLLAVDWLGRERRRLSSRASVAAGAPLVGLVDAEMFHHELAVTAAGTWLTLDKEDVFIDSFPRSYQTPSIRVPSHVSSDVVLELDPDTGDVLSRWSAADVLDRGRIGYGSLDGRIHGFDWLHANAVDETDTGFVVSLRHQDAVVAVDGATGALRWVLAPHDNWGPDHQDLLLEPVGEPFAWAYHGHGAEWSRTAAGLERIVLFDNGNGRASPWTGEVVVPDAENASRAVAYDVDAEARTVRQVWSWGEAPARFVPMMGDADALPGGGALVTFAAVAYEGGVPPASPMARVLELDAGGAVVWDLAIGGEPGGAGWDVYRAERAPGAVD